MSIKALSLAAIAAFAICTVKAEAATVLAAGDVGNCRVSTDTAVGNVIRNNSGTVLALGDLAYNVVMVHGIDNTKSSLKSHG